MEYITKLLQIVVAFGLLNVWLIRSNKQTAFRGANASSLKDEFIAYGLPVWYYYTIGFIKILSALLLLLGLWFPALVLPTACIVTVLMLGAITMHLKVGDPFKKAIPALIMLLLSLGICFGAYYHN